MVKIKTRRTAGYILVYGGLGVVFLTHAYLLYNKIMTSHALWNLAAATAILIGGLWGMKKR